MFLNKIYEIPEHISSQYIANCHQFSTSKKSIKKKKKRLLNHTIACKLSDSHLLNTYIESNNILDN